ncbi:alpha-L-rhamnosidase N-terminal domain-containing protein, partial [Streptomyces resistomycificus]
RYHWRVRAWDDRKTASPWSAHAYFETGLLDSGDWDGAQWITRPEAASELDQWTDYTATVEFKIDSAALGMFLRASDASNGYMWQFSVTGSTPMLRLHKQVKGNYSVVKQVDLAPYGFTNASLLAARHTVRYDVVGTTIKTTLDGKLVDTFTDATFSKGYIGFRTHGCCGERGTVYDAVVTSPDDGTLLDTDFASDQNPFTGGEIVDSALVVSGTTDALYGPPARPLPLLRKGFVTRTGKKVASARIYASALGVYELEVNGKPVGDQVLAPGWTNYHKRIQSQTYDVTKLLDSGDNAIGASLATGWWAGKVGLGWSRQY